MKRGVLAALIVLGVALGGCVSGQPDLTPAQRVYAIQFELDATLEQVEVYAQQPPCTDVVVVACRNPDALSSMIDAGEDADAALDTAEMIVRDDDPANDSRALIYVDAARAALRRIATLLVERETGK